MTLLQSYAGSKKTSYITAKMEMFLIQEKVHTETVRGLNLFNYIISQEKS